MEEIIDSIENGQFRQAREQISQMGFSDFAASLEGWLNLDLINQEQFNKLALVGLYAAGKIID